MLSIKAGKRFFAVFNGKITTDSYSTTIKKLTFWQGKAFVQIVPCRLVAGYRHLAVSLEHAFDSIGRKTGFSGKPALEFLAMLFGERQLGRAIEKARFGDEEIVLIIEGKNKNFASSVKKALGFIEKKSGLVADKDCLLAFYGVTRPELASAKDLGKAALEELVIEKTCFVEFK